MMNKTNHYTPFVFYYQNFSFETVPVTLIKVPFTREQLSKSPWLNCCMLSNFTKCTSCERTTTSGVCMVISTNRRVQFNNWPLFYITKCASTDWHWLFHPLKGRNVPFISLFFYFKYSDTSTV